MSAIETLPGTDDVAKLLRGLVGKEVKVKTGAAVNPGSQCPCVIALFNADDGRAAGAWVCDLAIASRLGAALTMFPKSAAEECIKSGKLTEGILDNLREVMNVASRVFNSGPSVHTRLISVHCSPPDELPAPLAALLATPADSIHLEVHVDGYGSGSASIHVGA